MMITGRPSFYSKSADFGHTHPPPLPILPVTVTAGTRPWLRAKKKRNKNTKVYKKKYALCMVYRETMNKTTELGRIHVMLCYLIMYIYSLYIYICI